MRNNQERHFKMSWRTLRGQPRQDGALGRAARAGLEFRARRGSSARCQRRRRPIGDRGRRKESRSVGRGVAADAEVGDGEVDRGARRGLRRRRRADAKDTQIPTGPAAVPRSAIPSVFRADVIDVFLHLRINYFYLSDMNHMHLLNPSDQAVSRHIPFFLQYVFLHSPKLERLHMVNT